jgi:hypothetical protein
MEHAASTSSSPCFEGPTSGCWSTCDRSRAHGGILSSGWTRWRLPRRGGDRLRVEAGAGRVPEGPDRFTPHSPAVPRIPWLRGPHGDRRVSVHSRLAHRSGRGVENRGDVRRIAVVAMPPPTIGRRSGRPGMRRPAHRGRGSSPAASPSSDCPDGRTGRDLRPDVTAPRPERQQPSWRKRRAALPNASSGSISSARRA